MSVVAPAAILFLHKGSIGSGIRLGFAAWFQTQIEQGLAKLAAAVKQLRQRAAATAHRCKQSRSRLGERLLAVVNFPAVAILRFPNATSRSRS
jgi:hypothetical protein